MREAEVGASDRLHRTFTDTCRRDEGWCDQLVTGEFKTPPRVTLHKPTSTVAPN